MPNNMYRRGADKERRIVNNARNKGWIAFRSAGSHSPIDVCCINTKTKEIVFIQSKGNKASDKYLDKLEDELKGLNGLFNVFVKAVRSSSDVEFN